MNASAAKGDTFSAPIQVYDSLGNAQTLSVNFTNTAPGAWSYTVTLPSSAVTGGTGPTTQLASGSIAFNSSGVLTTPAAGAPVAVTNTAALADGAATLNINWNLYDANGNSDLTGFAQTSASSGSTQDGSAPGTVTGVALANGGDLVATYSNGAQQTLAEVALANVANPGSMIATSGNNFELGPETMSPAVGAANTGGRGNIVSQSLRSPTSIWLRSSPT